MMSENPPPGICAVVVSYNRKELLLRCLDVLVAQTRPVDQIIVVDNASTDGTEQLVKEHGFFDRENFRFHALSENKGGAGGFCHGVRLAFDSGFDYIWLMDDDGFPSEDCLAKLLNYTDQFDYVGPLVVDDNDRQKLSFPVRLSGQTTILRTKCEVNALCTESKIMNNVAIHFNGALLSRPLLEKTGFPDERFFIWGDETEFTLRARAHGAKIATIADIFFYHRFAPDLGTPIFFGNMQFNDTDSNLKLYCLCRNSTYSLKKYRGSLFSLAFVMKVCWFYMFTKPSTSKLKLTLGALKDGWLGQFGKHKKYIPGNS